MIRVLIVDDSSLARRVLRELLSSDPSIEVVGEASDGQEAISKVIALRPDVVTMDVRMPVLDGLAATEQIMAYHPTRILAVTSLVSQREINVGFQMLGAGALDVMDKPASLRGPELERMRRELIERVKLLSRVRVVTHLRGRRTRNLPTPTIVPALSGGVRSSRPVVVIGASTGGPKALQTVLAGLPKDFSAPIVVVQHIAEGFVAGMVEWLSATCRLPIVLARHGQRLQSGEVVVASDGMHLLVDEEQRVIQTDLPQTPQRPSVDVTMESVAQSVGRRAIGVLLTGMGRDGALGMAAIRRAGGYTIAQDEATSAIFGMPKAAIEMGAVVEVLPVEQIAPALLVRLGAEQRAPTSSP